MTPGQWLRWQRTVAAKTVLDVMGLWDTAVDAAPFGAAWSQVVPDAYLAVTAGQYRAAERATDYVSDQVPSPAPAGPIRPDAFAGIASDGRPLETLLQLPAITTIRALREGAPDRVAFSLGRQRLGMLTSTQVFDAGRVATSVAQVAEPKVKSYTRVLRGSSSCARCVILAGRRYSVMAAFQRHPRCDCAHVASTLSRNASGDVYLDDGLVDSRDHFENLDRAEQDRVFTAAGAQAIRDGADVEQVVNARRGMKSATVYGKRILTTTEGTTDTAWAGRRLRAAGEAIERRQSLTATTARGARRTRQRINVPRLMPEQIYRDARNRDDAIRLLRRFGYL